MGHARPQIAFSRSTIGPLTFKIKMEDGYTAEFVEHKFSHVY